MHRPDPTIRPPKRDSRRLGTLLDHLPAALGSPVALGALLPCEPNGLSLRELAADLLGRRDPAALADMAETLAALGLFLGGLARSRGPEVPLADDELPIDRPDAELYGLPRDTYTLVRRVFGSICVARTV